MDHASASGTREGAIATFIIDWPVLVVIGLLFGGYAPPSSWWTGRAFRAGLLTAAVFTGSAVVGYLVAPDWMWMYFLDPSEVAWAVPFLLAGYLFTFVLAFAAGSPLRRASGAAWTSSIVAAVALEVVVIALTWSRYAAVGTAAEWVRGSAHDLVSSSPSGEARTIAMLGPVFAVVLVVALATVRKASREAPSDR